ncbi:hypothetical protein D5086_009657 [Populus alba]|uniref:Uncharacterized protein n=1 Tax=Populus alba TaxID=43335 RepID=A0ACC4C764_POPAL
MPVKPVAACNEMIMGFGLDGEVGRWGKREGVRPSFPSVISVLSVCGSLASLDHGRQVHSQLVRSQFDIDIYVSSVLITMYIKCGDLVTAERVFDSGGGSTSHPEHEMILKKLGKLGALLREAGYCPDGSFVMHDVDEEDKVHSLRDHMTNGNYKHLITGRLQLWLWLLMATFLRPPRRFWCQKMWYGAIMNSDANVNYISYEC